MHRLYVYDDTVDLQITNDEDFIVSRNLVKKKKDTTKGYPFPILSDIHKAEQGFESSTDLETPSTLTNNNFVEEQNQKKAFRLRILYQKGVFKQIAIKDRATEKDFIWIGDHVEYSIERWQLLFLPVEIAGRMSRQHTIIKGTRSCE